MNGDNSSDFLLQRYLETMSTMRDSMNSVYSSMLNNMADQEHNMTALLYHYIDSMRMREENRMIYTPRSSFTSTANDLRNRRGRGATSNSATSNSATSNGATSNSATSNVRNQSRSGYTSLYNRTRTQTRPRDNAQSTYIPRNNLQNNPTDEVWSAILNFANLPNLTSEILRPVVVHPTLAQIQRSTENMIFSTIENPTNNTCSISQEDFRPNDRVTRILHCGHIFFPSQIREWFRQNVRCPVCRFDIRNHVHRQVNNEDISNTVDAGISTSNTATANANTATANTATASTWIRAARAAANTATANANMATANANTATANANMATANIDTSANTTAPNITTITPPSNLVQLAQTISTELMNAFQDIAPSQHGDIIIEYGMIPNPGQSTPLNNSNISNINHTDISNGYYDGVD